MSIDFATLQALEIPEGVVTQIEDSSGRVLWAVRGTKVVLAVKKWTATTYAGETEREGEVFVAFDIYPNPYGVVQVTYNGHTKTISDTTGASEPNAQTVYFGTLYGESDGVEILESATLTIEGGFKQFGVGSYTKKGKYGDLDSTGYCGCVTSVIEWGNITRIADSAFYNCAGLTSISIPNGVTSIGGYAFVDCTGLTSIDIPDGVTSIGNSAFNGCSSLALTSLPSGITSIGGYAFYGCTGITLSSLPSGITSIGDYAFYDCTGITLSSLPSGITSIGGYAFYGCTGITLSSLPSGITSIGGYAFKDCFKVCITEFPEGLTSIGNNAFYMYTTAKEAIAMSGKSVTFPSTIQEIGDEAFRYNMYYNLGGDHHYYTYLGTAIMLSKTPPTIVNGSLGDGFYNDGSHRISIIVPKGCGEAYKTADVWSINASNITEAS